jgi:hypothetical protein
VNLQSVWPELLWFFRKAIHIKKDGMNVQMLLAKLIELTDNVTFLYVFMNFDRKVAAAEIRM